jgi:hypothetical protein
MFGLGRRRAEHRIDVAVEKGAGAVCRIVKSFGEVFAELLRVLESAGTTALDGAANAPPLLGMAVANCMSMAAATYVPSGVASGGFFLACPAWYSLSQPSRITTAERNS